MGLYHGPQTQRLYSAGEMYQHFPHLNFLILNVRLTVTWKAIVSPVWKTCETVAGTIPHVVVKKNKNKW